MSHLKQGTQSQSSSLSHGTYVAGPLGFLVYGAPGILRGQNGIKLDMLLDWRG